jgi:lysozyme family protein
MTDPRAPIFAAVRNLVPEVWSDPGNILAMDNLLDGLNVPRELDEADAFTAALAVILRHEGGFVNHPRDPGGMTNLGITKTTLESWLKRTVSEADMRALTAATVAPIYRQRYWDVLKCDDMPAAIALCVFDFGVNAGPARAARYLQKLAGTPQDGIVGPATIAAVNAKAESAGIAAVVKGYQDARRGYYRQLSHFDTFGKGWLRRVDETEAAALEMAR